MWMYQLSSSCRNCLGFHIFIQTRKTDLDYFSNNMGFPGRSDGKESVCNARDPGSILGWGLSLGEKNGNVLQYSCLENPMGRGAWRATVQAVAKGWP